MKVTVIGAGYVGLVTAACFSEMGNRVVCVEKNAERLAVLRGGRAPIHEPELDELLSSNLHQGRLHFAESLQTELLEDSVVFIAVGTPPSPDGSADISDVLAVARDIGRLAGNGYLLVVTKSTVPVGTTEAIEQVIQEEANQRDVSLNLDVASNPEFLKEGEAIADFLKPDRIIIGTDSKKARQLLTDLYRPFNRNHNKMLYMGARDAEMTKYAANAMLATRISFMNEVALLCERKGVDVENVRLGIGADQRIGYAFIYPGAGYGGSCFPKDVKALIQLARNEGIEPEILAAVESRNQAQKSHLFNLMGEHFGPDALAGKTIAVWGLAFKPGTDDVREATSEVLIRHLVDAGVRVRAFDPMAMDAARKQFCADWFTGSGAGLELCDDQYQALEGASALVLVTEWKPFRRPDFSRMKQLMNQPVIFDGRNQYDPESVTRNGFIYYGIGRRFFSAAET